jgi:hypothetical protein
MIHNNFGIINIYHSTFKYENNFQLKKLISDWSIFVSDVLRQEGTPYDEHDNVELKKPSSCQIDFFKRMTHAFEKT